MDSFVGFYIYAAIFRLAIIAAGIVSIVLGYKLFVIGVMGEGGTDVDAQVDQLKIIVRNAAPGTVFALFGAFIIAVMLFQGNPELVLQDVHTVTKDSQGNSQSEVQIGGMTLKGGSDHKANEALQRFDQAFDEAVREQRSGNLEAAITAYYKVLAESEVPLVKAATVFNDLAWIYQKQGRSDEALALARVATTIDREDPKSFDTMARILMDQRKYEAAERAAETAVKLDPAEPEHRETLQQVSAARRAEK